MPPLLKDDAAKSGRQFEFAIIARGIDPEADAFEDCFFEAGCDDALISVVKGAVVLNFSRESKNFLHALISAIRDVRAAGAMVARVEPDTLVSMSDIAERVGATRQSVSLLIQGERGPGGFPSPAARVTTDSPLWDWVTVARWLRRHGRLRDQTAFVQAALIREINSILETRQEHQPRDRILERALELEQVPVPA